MAKGNLNGVRRGKQGNTVFYKIANSNNKETQGSREYVSNIRNPKTNGQIMQRMKLAPAVNFYRAFATDILDHSWEGVQYGGRSHAKFMKLALSGVVGFPYITKGSNTLAPARYPVSRGSLAPIEVTNITSVANQHDLIKNSADFCHDESENWDEWLRQTFAAMPWLQQGDQITLAAIVEDAGDFYPRVARIVLDPNKYPTATTGEDVMSQAGIYLMADEISFFTSNALQPVLNIAAAAVIVSRPVISKTSGTVSWKRSDADMFVNPTFEQQFFSQAAYEAAFVSYRDKSASATSNWYLNDGTTQGSDGSVPVAPNIVTDLTESQWRIVSFTSYGKWKAGIINGNNGKSYVIGEISYDSGQGQGSLTWYAWSASGASPVSNKQTLYEQTEQLDAQSYNELTAAGLQFITATDAVALAASAGITITINE